MRREGGEKWGGLSQRDGGLRPPRKRVQRSKSSAERADRLRGLRDRSLLAKMSATAAPMKPKNGAEGGQSGLSTMMLSRACGRMTFAVSKIGAAT